MLVTECIKEFNELNQQFSTNMEDVEEVETLSVHSDLKANQNSYRVIRTSVYTNDGRLRELSLGDQIKKACNEMQRRDIVFFDELPHNGSDFYMNSADTLAQCRGKIFFLLNSTIYKYCECHSACILPRGVSKATTLSPTFNTSISRPTP